MWPSNHVDKFRRSHFCYDTDVEDDLSFYYSIGCVLAKSKDLNIIGQKLDTMKMPEPFDFVEPNLKDIGVHPKHVEFVKANTGFSVNILVFIQHTEAVHSLVTNLGRKGTKADDVPINLLQVTMKKGSIRYLVIEDVDRFLQWTNEKGKPRKRYYCLRCLRSFTTESTHKSHVEGCRAGNQIEKMPAKDEHGNPPTLSFQNYLNQYDYAVTCW